MRILAIETSCDETAVAIAEFSGSKKKPAISVLSNIISSQVKLHAKYGGVVPNLAKREHQRNLVPILLEALKKAGLQNSKPQNPNHKQIPNSKFQNSLNAILEREPELLKHFTKSVLPLKPPLIDAIAVTYGPGLAPALWVGVNFTKALALLWEKPLIPVNHMSGHLYSALLQKNHKSQITNHKQIQNPKFKTQKDLEFGIWNLEFPAIALLVSGGHTELVLMRGHRKFKVIGETLDDAAGEAFDKVARILGLGYPGGPEISRLSEKGDPQKYPLPSPMINSKDYNFSFSGLKTAVLYLVNSLPQTEFGARDKADIASSFQKAAVDVLVKKTVRAAGEYKVKTVLLGGGVAANKLLRQRLTGSVERELLNTRCLTVLPELAGDNALMIALAAYFSRKKKAPDKVGADANAKLH